MPDPAERASAPPEGEPLAHDGIRDLSTVFRILGGLEKGANLSESTIKSHTEKIEQLMQWASAIPNIENDVAQNTKNLAETEIRLRKDINELGVRLGRDITKLQNAAHTAEQLFKIAAVIFTVIGAPLLLYLYHHVTLTFKP